MMNPTTEAIQPAFDYRKVSSETRGFVKQRAVFIRDTAKQTAESIIRIGQWLTEVKERLDHGQWLPWLKAEFGWSQPSAFNFMRVYERFKLAKFDNLQIDASALYLIAAPSTPEPVVKEVIERASKGEPMTRTKALEVLESYKSRVELPPPSVARQIAIATGAATAASNNVYILPMSKEAEEALTVEQSKIRRIYNALEELAQTAVTPQEMAALGQKHGCCDLDDYTEAATRWINSLLEALHERKRARQVG